MKSKILMIACALAFGGTTQGMEMPIEHLNQQLLQAAQQDNAAQVATLLQNKDINVNIQDVDKWTPIHWAVYNKNIEIIKLLLAHPHIDVNLKDSYGTPLHRAIANNWLRIIPFGETATRVENIEIVKLLLDHPAVDVNAEHCYKIYADDDCYKRATAFQKACGKDENELFPVKNKEALIQLFMNHCDHSSATMQKSKKLLAELQADKTYFALLHKDLFDMLAPYLHCKSVTDEAALEILKDRTINPSIKAVIKNELTKRSPLRALQEEDTELIVTGKHTIKVTKNNKKNNEQNCSIS